MLNTDRDIHSKAKRVGGRQSSKRFGRLHHKKGSSHTSERGSYRRTTPMRRTRQSVFH